MWRLHCVRWDNMLNTVWMLSCERLETVSWQCPLSRSSPSVSTASISSVTWKQLLLLHYKKKNQNCTCISCLSSCSPSPPAALLVCSPATCKAEYVATGRGWLCSHAWWWNYSRWTLCLPAHASPNTQTCRHKSIKKCLTWSQNWQNTHAIIT